MARRAALIASSVVLVGVSSLGWRWLSSDEREHDRTVAALERRAEGEDGWLVFDLPNLHEGGGTTTWWLHPCDPDVDTVRDVTRTAYHGSDVAGVPGLHRIERTTIGCAPPVAELRVAGDGLLRLDRRAVQLGPRLWAPLEPADAITLTDVDHGTDHTLATTAGNDTSGPCDGSRTWQARLRSAAELTVAPASCAGTLAALPAAARVILDPPADPSHREDDIELPADRVAAFGQALREAGWAAEEVEFRDLDGTTSTPVWYGPCLPAYDDGRVRTIADWHAGVLVTSQQGCDG